MFVSLVQQVQALFAIGKGKDKGKSKPSEGKDGKGKSKPSEGQDGKGKSKPGDEAGSDPTSSSDSSSDAPQVNA